MAYATPKRPNSLYGLKKVTRFDKGLGAQLPEAYKKFWREWKHTKPTAVHYIPKDSEWQRDEVTNEIKLIQNVLQPFVDSSETYDGLWGGEAATRGIQKQQPTKRRSLHSWLPVLRRSVIHSAVLNKYMSMVVTDRILDKIHESHGFDHYLLKTLACDLQSTLAFKLKRKILLELLHGCPTYADKPQQQNRLLKEYKRYLEAYTPEEIEWYGHTYLEAIHKLQAEIRARTSAPTYKIEFHSKLIEQLRNAGIQEAGSRTASDAILKDNDSKDAGIDTLAEIDTTEESLPNWLSKINLFGKKPPT